MRSDYYLKQSKTLKAKTQNQNFSEGGSEHFGGKVEDKHLHSGLSVSFR